MRGKPFHNLMVRQAKSIFKAHGWKVNTEYRCRQNGITTYFDMFAVKYDLSIACEVETTVRHAVDNAIKAQTVGVSLWIIVPTRKLRVQIERKLRLSPIVKNYIHVKIMLLNEINHELDLL